MTTYKAPPNRTGRVMNSQMNVSLPVEMHERLRELAWQERMPLSHLCRELLEAGMLIREKKRRGRRRGRGLRSNLMRAVEEQPSKPLWNLYDPPLPT